MKREPMVYAVAGMIFGFVLGYMVANAGGGAESRPAAGGTERAASASQASHPPGAHNHPIAPLDPNELRALESLAARDKSNVQVRVDLANLLLDHARYEEAARWYREVLALRPGDKDALVDLGACLLHLGRPDEALAHFDQALKSEPGHKKALFNKGLALLEGGRPKEALAVWEGLLRRYPGDPQLEGLREQIDHVRVSTRSSP